MKGECRDKRKTKFSGLAYRTSASFMKRYEYFPGLLNYWLFLLVYLLLACYLCELMRNHVT